MSRFRTQMRISFMQRRRIGDAIRRTCLPATARRAFLACALLAPLSVPAQTPATFPSKPLRIVVASAQGSGVDILARAFAERLRVVTGTAAIVENKPGASGLLAANHFVSLPADGHTLLTITSSSMNLVPLMQKVQYDETLIRPVIGFSRHTGMIVSSAASGPATLKQIVDDARAKPGTLNVGTYSAHFQVALKALEKQVGATFNNVPYKGPPDLFLSVGEGSIPLALADLGTAVRYVETGKVRPVATAADVRHPSFPDTPTFKELGYPGYEVYEIAGFGINGETPEPQIQQMEALLLKVAADPEYQKLASRLPGAVLTQVPGRDFASMLAQRRAQQRELLRELGELAK
jgi:tripartite-type tricarboxylate transporter receptor subunit TctC